jgi:hypothetical protein
VTSDWGSIQLGRTLLREVFAATEQGGNTRTLALTGQESNPPLTRAVLIGRHDNINAMDGASPVAVTFTDKSERDGYYQVTANASKITEYVGDQVTADWQVTLTRLGTAGEVDIQSRLTGVKRLNDFDLTGERWHAPAIGHYAYYTGSTEPTSMTRDSEDGTVTVYRGVPLTPPARWGCDPGDYLQGRVRITDTGAAVEVEGTGRALPADDWSLSNGLVNVTPGASAGVLDVQAYTGAGWHSKLWNITIGGSAAPEWDAASVIRNDLEHCIVRLTASRNPGRVTLDLALRRGGRIVEGYLQTGTSTTLAVYLADAETNTSAAASGYVVASADDGDGNRFACGSAREFTAHADGGLSLAATTALDFWVGVVAGGTDAVDGDTATDLRNMYIGSLAEATYAVRR